MYIYTYVSISIYVYVCNIYIYVYVCICTEESAGLAGREVPSSDPEPAPSGLGWERILNGRSYNLNRCIHASRYIPVCVYVDMYVYIHVHVGM